ncbi:macro domain-containing protein [Pseudoflavitalea sp. X16]|uniref:macro domain-containing protein n=1 Tax=Paraflavitalea devenefica TaxID=2716334 RepID=UPI00141D794D|nr:macro domain-containing protein [Paraflavitalea devenefica]NII24476.1 macro domain-containing protein [Paraflavitalea devenefica]
MAIQYIKGDATAPVVSGNKIIVHVCNDIGSWGRGFVMALSAKWKEPKQSYKKWFQSKENFALGEVQFVPVSADTWVANMIGQHDIKNDKAGNPPVRYDAIKIALEKVALFAKEKNASVHMPRIGCGLAGGTWDKMEPVIEAVSKQGVPVTVYDL